MKKYITYQWYQSRWFGYIYMDGMAIHFSFPGHWNFRKKKHDIFMKNRKLKLKLKYTFTFLF